ncbi:hypothetical protein PENSPDRAFT_359533 [Peniophora sp. CONT]|nr:hypothetical protein PENSPDRAFT_359533 [Peniophora sp. CONT]
MLLIAADTTIVVHELFQVRLCLSKLLSCVRRMEMRRGRGRRRRLRTSVNAVLRLSLLSWSWIPRAALAGAWVENLFATARTVAHLAAHGGADSTPPEYERVALMERDDMTLDRHTDCDHAPLARQAQNGLAELHHLSHLFSFMSPFAKPGLVVWTHVGRWRVLRKR